MAATEQQKKDNIELDKLYKAQPAVLRGISGIWESINISISKSVDTTGDLVKGEKAFVDLAKQVLSKTGEIHKESVDWLDITLKILEAQKAGDKQLVRQYKQLGKIQAYQKRYNNLVNAGVNSVEKMVSGVENLVREIPVIGEFLADFINFGDISKNMANTLRGTAEVSGDIFGDVVSSTLGNVTADAAAGLTGLGDVGADATAAAGDEEESAAVGKEQDICDCIGKEAKEESAAEDIGYYKDGKWQTPPPPKLGGSGILDPTTGKPFPKSTPDIEEAAEATQKVGQENEKVDKTSGKVKKKWGKLKLLSLGIAAGVAAMAASMVKFAFDSGLSLGQMVKMGPALLINQKYVSAMAEEFGTINDVNGKIAWQLKKQSFFYGISAEQAVKILRIQTALSDSSHEQLIDIQNSVAQFARMKGVLPSKVFEDIAGSTELMAKHAHGSAEEFMRAAVEIRAMGVGLDVADQIATHLLDIEGSINAQFEANAVLGRSMNFDTARRLMMQDDLTGMMEEIKRQVGGEAAFQKLNRLERELLSKSIGTDVSNLAKLVTEEEKASAAVENQKNKWVAIGGIVLGLVGAMIGAMNAIPIVGTIFSMKGLAGMAIGAATGGAIGMGLGATFGGAATPKAHDGGQVEVKSGEVILNKLQQKQLQNSDPQLVSAIKAQTIQQNQLQKSDPHLVSAIQAQTLAFSQLNDTLRKGQIRAEQQRDSQIEQSGFQSKKLMREFG